MAGAKTGHSESSQDRPSADAVTEQLLEGQEVSRELLETAAQAIFVVDAEERIVRVNEAATGMFGYGRLELTGKKLELLIPRGLRQDHSKHVASYFEHPRRRAMGVCLDLMAQRKDGSQIPVEMALSHVRVDGKPFAVAFVSDISLRKSAEQEIIRHREDLRELTNRLITAAEDETRRWARDSPPPSKRSLPASSERMGSRPNSRRKLSRPGCLKKLRFARTASLRNFGAREK